MPAELDSHHQSSDPPSDLPPQPRDIIKSVIREALEIVVLTLLIFWLVQSSIRNFQVHGQSMAPGLEPGQYLVVDRLSHKWLRDFERGDIIVFDAPDASQQDFIKRVIALPGEQVEIKAGVVWVDGKTLHEPYHLIPDTDSLLPLTVSENHLFVLGDNRANSSDSRTWGLLPDEAVIGRAWLSFWPPNTWGLIPKDAPVSSARFFTPVEKPE